MMTEENPDVKATMVEILKSGILGIRRSRDLRYCQVEANHLHNIPDMLAQLVEGALDYYLDVEVPEYVRDVGQAVPANVSKAWGTLDEWRRNNRRQTASTF